MIRQPYIGLRAFGREDQGIFFGREQHSNELIERLNQQHFLGVVGDSGCGKSSLVKAGLIPSLQAGFLAEAGSHWRIAELHPGNSPYANLAEALLMQDALGSEYQTVLTELPLTSSPFSLHEVMSRQHLPNNAKLLIICDQFEELFRYAKQQANDLEAAAFAAFLLACASPYYLRNGEVSDDIYVIVTMRSDYLGNCAQFTGLAEAINQGLYLTPRLNRLQLRSAIERPATVCGGQVEPALLVRLLGEIGNDADQLPLLQHLLMRMWDKAIPETGTETNCITLADYQDEKILSLKHALSAHADDAYKELTAEQKQVAKLIFCRLTGAESGKNDTRNPTKVKDLLALTGSTLTQLNEVLMPFRQMGRCFLLPPEETILDEEKVIDITHESLIRNWQQLDDWTREEAQAAETYRHLLESALRYRNRQIGLLQEPELSLMLQWRKTFQPTAAWAMRYGKYEEDFPKALAFLAESAKWQRLRKVLYVAGFISMTGLAGFATYEWSQADKHKHQIGINLFQSRLTHASLLARGEDYLGAKQVLNDTDALDKEVSDSMRHARNLLRSFTDIMGGEADATFDGKGAGYALYTTAISPDGQLLAAGGENGSLVIFDAATGKLLQRLEGHATEGDFYDNSVRSIAFTPKGDTLISAGDDKKIILWQRQGQSFDKPQVLAAPDKVMAIALSPDGQLLASGGDDNTVSLWSLPDGKLLKTLKQHTQRISGLDFSADGRYLASGSYDDLAIIWDVASGKPVHTLRGHNGDVNQLTFSADGQTLATGSEDKIARLWAVASGQLQRSLVGHSNNVFEVQFIGNDDTLLSAGADRALRLWDSHSGVTLRVLQGHEAGVTQAAVYGDRLFTASNDGTVRRWRLGLPYQQRVALPNTPLSNAITPNLTQVAVGFENGTLSLYDTDKQTRGYEKEKAHAGNIYHLTFNEQGTLFVSAGFTDQIAKLWEVKQNQLIEKQTFTGHDDAVYRVAISPDSQTLATASYDGKIGLFKLGSQEKPRFIENAHDGKVESVAFSQDGKQLLSAGYEDRLIKLWDSQTGQGQTLAQANDMVLWSSWSPDNQSIAAVGRTRNADVYDTLSRTLKYHFVGHEQTIFKAIFSPDSQQLATVSSDTTAKFWELGQGKELFSVHLPTNGEQGTPLWDFDFRCQAANCVMAVPLVRGLLQLYQFCYEGKPNFDAQAEKRALLPLWQSYLEEAKIEISQNALNPALQTLREIDQIASHYPAELVNDNDYKILKKGGDCLKQSAQQVSKTENQLLDPDCELILNEVKTADQFNGLGLAYYKQKQYSQAQAVFAKGLEQFPVNLALLCDDTELALVQGDKPRMQQRMQALQSLYQQQDGIYTDSYPAIMSFLAYLSDDQQKPEPVLDVIEHTDPSVSYNWDFSDIEPVLKQLTPAKQKNAKLFIDFFQQKLDLHALKRKLK